ncbi:tetratricopeptide repeat protein [Paraburkholderia sp. SARCC-3016]|uniref:tetratricopeptide repeat protein n=1 Tax=Paraburkholderia sp. SARCC-3016 TaxID=3058611 RepID=UPI002806A643|nr:tetratricopeptide repeat protein [Paraburkholderia sp. SARCC-3016]MDQ7981733.1 tetratricopeptide repeat protein [Paraburkholderia sp. SARCC-3016]
MKNAELRSDSLMSPVHQYVIPPSERLAGLIGCCAAALVAMSACTTTYHVSKLRETTHSTTPDSMSELRIANTALDSGNLELATTLYEKVVATDPRSVAGLTGLGDTLYAVGDFTRAAVYYERARQVDAAAIAPTIGAARVAIHQRRFDDAISIYRKVLVVTPDAPLASAGLGAALDMKGDHVAAQEVLRQSLRANPGDPALSVNLGLSLTLGGNPREGVNVLLDVTRFPGAPPEARQDLALAYGLLGNTEAAAAILRQDLPKASVEDNLRFYAIQREQMFRPANNGAKGAGATPTGTTPDTSPSVTVR